MAGGIIVVIVTAFLSFGIVAQLKGRFPFIDAKLLNNLFFYHLLLALAYYLYVLFNPSDSKNYYASYLYATDWFSLYGTSTTFIKFLAYPFSSFFGFSYEASMALFSWFGYLGFIYFYIFFKENIHFKHTLWGMDLMTLFFFLPNLHFWSSSIGKGSVIFLGLGLFFYGLSRIRERIPALIISGFLIYHIRPHIMLVVLVSTAIGFMFSSRGISTTWRIAFLFVASVAFFFIYRDVLKMVGIDEDAALSQGLDLTHRATELTKATSGVDITNYSLPMQLFTFLFRPLFIDAPGALGIFVSFENVFYLVVTLMMLSRAKGWKFLFGGSILTKAAFISFVTVSIALAQISGNLGLAIRQKSQVMILFMFVIISFLDDEKLKQWRAAQAAKLRRQKQQQAREAMAKLQSESNNI